MTDLKEIPSYELQAELKRRSDEAEQERLRKEEEHREKVVKHIDAILDFYPEHGRTSCSDEHPDNPGRCFRCDLLQIKREGYWSNLSVSLDLCYSR